MKSVKPLLVVTDLARSRAFYEEVLGLHVIADFGANITLTGGLSLQTLDSWKEFIGTDVIAFGGNDTELYFEEENFDVFIARLEGFPTLSYVHPAKEHAWGQRAVRFYDPDRHIIEVGESMHAVTKRFADQGMTVEQIAQRMDVPLRFVKSYLK